MNESETDASPPYGVHEGEEEGPPSLVSYVKGLAINALKKLFGVRDDPCEDTLIEGGTTMLNMGCISFGLLLILILLEKRKAKWLDCCGGRGGIVLSVNFLENKANRGMIVAAFIFTASDLWRVISEFEAFKGIPPFIAALLKCLVVMAFSLSYIPLFNCISVDTVFRELLGFVYILAYTALSIIESTSVCSFDLLSNETLSYQLVKYVVLTGSGGFLALKFLQRFIVRIGQCRSPPKPVYVHPYQIEYIKNVLHPPAKPKIKVEGLTFKDKMKMIIRKLSYHSIPGFRYSISILASIAVGMLIYVLLIRKTIAKSVDSYHYLSRKIEANRENLTIQIPNIFVIVAKAVAMTGAEFDASISNETTITLFELLDDQVDCIFGSVFFAISLSSVQVALTVLLMLKGYRKNLLHMYRQQPNEDLLSVKDFSHVSLVVSAIQFIGYQVAHMVWGYALQALVFFIIFFIIGEFIILPVKFGYWGVVRLIFNKFGPILTVILVTMIIQNLLVKFVFLTERGKVFGIDNRKAFYNFMFFMFYYNVLTGMLTCIIRVLKALLLGVWFFPRLDMSIFPRIGERFDTGYKAYVCLLTMEQLQSNIILDTFFQLLIEASKNNSSSMSAIRMPLRNKKQIFPTDYSRFLQEGNPIRRNYVWTNDLQLTDSSSVRSGRKPLPPQRMVVTPFNRNIRDKRARNRWFLAWTLIHNPTIQCYRRWTKHEKLK